MIIGFDYQTPEVIAQELDGPHETEAGVWGSSSFMGPVPGTPFHERVKKDNLPPGRSIPENRDLFFRRADGFATMMKHPTLSPAEIEELQRWCFREDFERLGPSIFRTLEARLLGYQRLKNSPNRWLRAKAQHYAKELRVAYPAFLAGRLLGPNAAIRRWIGDLERRICAELGAPSVRERVKSVAGVGAALWTGLTLKLNLFQHPRLMRTSYRMPEKRWGAFHLWEDLRRHATGPDLAVHVDVQHAKKQVWLRLEGGPLRGHKPRGWDNVFVSRWCGVAVTWCSI
jgi:hypothetical protein